MAQAASDEATWETTRVSEPMDYPSIIFSNLAALLETPLGKTARHRALQDLEAILSPHIDTRYEDAVKRAAETRDRIRNGKEDGVDPREALDFHQSLWLKALMQLMQTSGILGEKWVRG